MIVFGVGAAAVAAIYRFVVENAAAIAAFAAVAGGIVVLAYLFSRIRSRRTISPDSAELSQLAIPTRDVSRASSAPPLSARSRTPSARWVDASERVKFGAIEISGGMFYLGDWIPVADGTTSRYAISPRLPYTAQRPDIEGSSMPYWPSYAEITPAARRAFLDWMASGRNDPSYGVGHVFLFFYGLEHRQFIDRDFASTSLIVREVERLLSIYGKSNSFRGYATNFLTLSKIGAGEPLEAPPLSAERNSSQEMDIDIRLHMGKRLSQFSTILSEDALLWVLALPDVYLRTAAVRCFEEFLALWHLRFQAKFPEGFKVETTGNIRLTYRSASGAFEVGIPGSHDQYPDICTATTSTAALKKLVQDCTEELDGFSRLIGRRPASRNSMQAALLLPDDLQNETGSGAIHLFGQRMAERSYRHRDRAGQTLWWRRAAL